MVTMQLQLPDELNTDLQEVASRNGSSPEDLVRDILRTHIAEELATQFEPTPELISRMRHSIDQLNRGEIVTSEAIDRRFEEWHLRRSAQ